MGLGVSFMCAGVLVGGLDLLFFRLFFSPGRMRKVSFGGARWLAWGISNGHHHHRRTRSFFFLFSFFFWLAGGSGG